MGEYDVEVVPLFSVCPQCGGAGRSPAQSQETEELCSQCDGKGEVRRNPTGAGRTLIEERAQEFQREREERKRREK